MVTLTEKGCGGIKVTDESRGEKLFAMVSQAAHKTCREEHTNKKRHRITFEKKKCQFNTQENEQEKSGV